MTVGCIDKDSDCEATHLPIFESWDIENLRYGHLTWPVLPATFYFERHFLLDSSLYFLL